MGSKGRMPPPYMRRPLPGPGMVHADPFGPGVRAPPGAFPPFDMPPAEVMEQKLVAQHAEMQKLATENQKLAATHGSLRQQLAGAQHELHQVHNQIRLVESEREQQMRGLMENIGKMEAELQAADSLKLELQQARAEAKSLITAREELISKAQQLTQDLQKAHTELQQVPSLMAEIENLRKEYQHCRATYDYEKKLYNDHLESLQVMEKNYINMAREVEKLQAELTNIANFDKRIGGHSGGGMGYHENEASVNYPAGQNAYEDSTYGVSQGRGPVPPPATGAGGGSAATPASASASTVTQSGPANARSGYDAPRGPGYDAQRGHGYDAQRGSNYDAQRVTGYDAHRGPNYDAMRGSGYDLPRGPGYDAPPRGPGYDAQGGPGFDGQRGYDSQRGHGYEAQRGQGYDAQRGSSYDTTKGSGYDAPSRGAGGPQGQVMQAGNTHYGSSTPPNRAAGGYEAPPPRGGNPGRR